MTTSRKPLRRTAMLRRSAALSTLLAGVLALLLTAPGPARAAAAPLARRVAAPAATTSSWPVAGHDLANDRFNPDEKSIGASNVAHLTRAWSTTFSGNLAATPIVSGGRVFMSSYGGYVSAFDATTGAKLWTHLVGAYTGLTGDVVRSSGAVHGSQLILVDRPTSNTSPRNGAHMIAVDQATGTMLWQSVIDPQKPAVVTGAPVVVGDVAYVGLSSDEELLASCCSFRGNLVAVDLTDGHVIWRTYASPAGYTGTAMWGSAPAVDTASGLIYVGTGNNYTVPAGVCLNAGQTGCTPPAADDYVDSVLAVSISTGRIVWALKTLGSDVYATGCTQPTTCGPDYDFGSDPSLYSATINGKVTKLVGVGQKTGIYYALDAATGKIVWQRQIGPDNRGGGIVWGSAVDGKRIYADDANAGHVSWKLQPGNTSTTTAGVFTALDPATGAIVWQTPDPQGHKAYSFVSTAYGVVYGGTSSGTGNNMYAMQATTGKILWSYAAGGSVLGGASIVNGTVYWAAGYYDTDCPAAQPGCGGHYTLYAFRLA